MSRALPRLGALFIVLFFWFFSYRGLSAYFTFDDGTTVIAALKMFETTFWQDLLHILMVFTTAFRPLTTLFWRPLYAAFGFNPLPYRIVVHLLLTVNIGVAYLVARRLELTREGAALATLVFCYNAATFDLYYNTCLVGDILCFLLYGLAVWVYVRGRQGGERPGGRATAVVAALYLLALDTKEIAVMLPVILVIYELLYRRGDFGDRRKALRVAALPASMLVAGAIYLTVKVADMSANAAYQTHATPGFVADNIAHYLEQLLYLPEKSLTLVAAGLIVGGVIAAGALLRSRAAIFGMLFFLVALIPVAAIASRGAYAAYVPYFGLALAAGAILAGARARLNLSGRLETATAVGLFLCAAVLLGWAHIVQRIGGMSYYEWSTPPVKDLMSGFGKNIPEFPPRARVLIDRDPWPPDWGQMFLVRLMYDDATVWVDRTKNMDRPPDLSKYDLVVSYQPPDVELVPARWHRHLLKWELRGSTTGTGQFLVSSPNAHGAAESVDLEPPVAKAGQRLRVTIPGLKSVTISVFYRTVSGAKSTVHLEEDWCTLDANGSCTVPAPWGAGSASMIVDWIQPANQRWILTHGVLTLTE